jgi:peptidoglycan/LPS O-acetylase OafA/YrhL
VDVLATVLLTDRGVLWRWGMLNPYQRMTALACVLLVGLVVLPRAGDQPSVLTRFLERRPLILCGLASYSLFLWHEPVTRLLAGRGLTLPGQGGLVGNLVLVAVLAGALAAATYRWVERPALARKVSSIRPESGTGAARRRRRAGRPHRPGGFSRKESAG